MAEEQQGQERTEEPTEKRLGEARNLVRRRRAERE